MDLASPNMPVAIFHVFTLVFLLELLISPLLFYFNKMWLAKGKSNGHLALKFLQAVVSIIFFFLCYCRVSFSDPVAVRHSLAIISELAARDPYSVAMSLGELTPHNSMDANIAIKLTLS